MDRLRHQIVIDDLNVRPGSSGAPLIASSGIVGMILRHDGETTRAVSIEAIAAAFEEWQHPWQLIAALEGASNAAAELTPSGTTEELLTASPPETAGASGAITDCDLLAAHPNDPDAVAPGIDFDKIDSARALTACRESVEHYPGAARHEFQYARALLKADHPEEALKWFHRAAEKDYSAAWHALGVLYAGGRGTAKDEASAAIWFRKAADRGHAVAQATLGDMYAEGIGVTRDDGEAVHWFRKAAEQDHAAAQARLGAMYAQGLGVARDDSEALRWLRKAAAHNDAYGQALLGYMYAEGRGTGRDLGEAERWLRKSAEQGYAWAVDRLERVLSERKLSTMQFSEARVENDFFVIEDGSVSWAGTSAIDAKLLFKPKRDLEVLLTQDWLRIDDEHGNNYRVPDMYSHALFERCEYESNVCLEKDFKVYKHGKDVQFNFRMVPTDRDRYKENPPSHFRFLIKFLVFRPDGNLVQPVAIRVPLRN